jgi:hypothetical protein
MAAKGSSTSAAPARTITVERQVRAMPSASARVAAPPPAPRSSAGARGGSFGGSGSGAHGGSSQMSTSSHASMSSASHSGGGHSH